MHQLPESAVHTATSSSFTQPDIWNLEDIGDYLGISESAARRLVAHSKFPLSIVNQSRNRRWFKDEVIEFLKSRSRGELMDTPRLAVNPHYIPKSIRVRQLKAVGS